MLLQVKALGQEVLAHLYEVVGTDAVLKAFNAARRDVLDRRQARRTRQAVQVSALPDAALALGLSFILRHQTSAILAQCHWQWLIRAERMQGQRPITTPLLHGSSR